MFIRSSPLLWETHVKDLKQDDQDRQDETLSYLGRPVVLGVILPILAILFPCSSPLLLETHIRGLRQDGQGHFVLEGGPDGALPASRAPSIRPLLSVREVFGSPHPSRIRARELRRLIPHWRNRPHSI